MQTARCSDAGWRVKGGPRAGNAGGLQKLERPRDGLSSGASKRSQSCQPPPSFSQRGPRGTPHFRRCEISWV